MKRTKIVATIGPATAEQATIKALVAAGANAFRINLSHGNPEQWAKLIDNIHASAPDAPIIIDTEGPEVRIINVPKPIELKAGQKFTFSNAVHAHSPHATHALHFTPGQTVLLDDGAMRLVVEHIEGNNITCLIQTDGILTDRRKLTVPSDVIDLPVLSESDVTNIMFCLGRGADAIALSFTQRAEDVATCRQIVGDGIMIIAKIENQSGVNEAEHIIKAADAVMIARGDLGVEIPLEDVPAVQKRLVRVANTLGKPVIVATQMLESMTTSPQPTRAEVSDVANAILDGADAVMLSGETARGKYPVQTVETMARIAVATDKLAVASFKRDSQGKISTAEAISAAVYDLAESLHANAIISATTSGFTARMVARFRPHVPVIAVAHDERTKRLLQLSWGVIPCVFPRESSSAHQTIPDALRAAVDAGYVQPDDLIIATAGVNTRKHGSTNLIEVHHVRELITFHEGR